MRRGQNKFQKKVGGSVWVSRFFSAVVVECEGVDLLGFLKGVAGKLPVWTWFFGGENVVGSVVDVAF